MNSLIFLDGGNPVETKEVKKALGHIDGQTTNPTLVSKNPEVMKYVVEGKKLTEKEALKEYKKIVLSIAEVTDGPISAQVIADHDTKAEEMIRQARVYRTWAPNVVVKFPITGNGLTAAEEFCLEGPVNLTLNFSQEQAAAVYVATKKAKHRVFISPFVGRLDDRGENGMDVVANILKMYQKYQKYQRENEVEVLTASVRRLSHILYALHLGSHAITIPFKLFKEWETAKFIEPMEQYKYEANDVKPIPYQEISLDRDWRDYDLHHDLTDAGLARFMEDWQSILQ